MKICALVVLYLSLLSAAQILDNCHFVCALHFPSWGALRRRVPAYGYSVEVVVL